MEYYVYVSDAKLEMLYEQIPTRLRDRLATELKIDLKLLSTAFSEQPSGKSKYAKLKLVTDFITKNKQVGTIDNPLSYFAGTLEMSWGPYGTGDEQIVYFGGSTNKTIIGLGGSLKHVIGNGTDKLLHSGSHTPYLLATLIRELQLSIPKSFPQSGKYDEHIEEINPDVPVEFLFEMGVLDYGTPGAELLTEESRLEIFNTYSHNEGMALAAVANASQYIPSVRQKLKFLAKKLIYSSDLPQSKLNWPRRNDKAILLGTPIFVATAD